MKIAPALLTLPVILALLSGCASSNQIPRPASQTPANPDFQGTYVDLKDVDQPPKAIKRVQPVYPFDLKRKGVNGYVLLEFIVDTSGNPVQIHAIRASQEAFIGVTIDCLSKWRFKPGIKNGEPCACRMQQPFTFSISER